MHFYTPALFALAVTASHNHFHGRHQQYVRQGGGYGNFSLSVAPSTDEQTTTTALSTVEVTPSPASTYAFSYSAPLGTGVESVSYETPSTTIASTTMTLTTAPYTLIGTGYGSSSVIVDNVGPSESMVVSTYNATLTYTLGTGTAKSVVTTTIEKTITSRKTIVSYLQIHAPRC